MVKSQYFIAINGVGKGVLKQEHEVFNRKCIQTRGVWQLICKGQHGLVATYLQHELDW